ncbi:MAG: polysaccharide biosynthesis protein [Spirochaetaceae bacterium]
MTGKKKSRIYIVGAGFAGRSIASEVQGKGLLGEVVAFLDDDSDKIGRRIQGIPVLGPIADVVALLDRSPGDEALIAVPSAPRERLKEIYNLLEGAGFGRIRILPSVSQIVEGDPHLIQTREIDPEDLLGRTPITLNLKESLSYLQGKRVLVTGAGGSIGSELTRQLLLGGAERLYLLGHGENSIYEIEKELRLLQEEGIGPGATIVPVIGELQDADFVSFILSRLRCDVVFHTAAYKHVPMMEANPVNAVANNVFGTENLVRAAKSVGTKRFVFVSTDKAVDPVSVYGASKRIAEDIVLSQNGSAGAYMVVRFGNVLGSRGSIIPLFRRQILKGGPVTITAPNATRFFMTIPEASSLVLQVGGVGSGGTLYLLDMGEPISIRDIAEQMIRFYGYTPETEIALRYIGLREGEKLTEALCAVDEREEPTAFTRIKRIDYPRERLEKVSQALESLRPICYRDHRYPAVYRNRKYLRSVLQSYIPTLPDKNDEPEY